MSRKKSIKTPVGSSFEVSILNHFLYKHESPLATSYEFLVTSTEFLVPLATRKAQFRTLLRKG